MSLVAAISVILGVAGVTGQLVMVRNSVAGWVIILATQPLWYALSITTGAYGLLLLNTGYFITGVLNLRKALSARHAGRPASPAARACAAGHVDDDLVAAALAEYQLRHSAVIPAVQ